MCVNLYDTICSVRQTWEMVRKTSKVFHIRMIRSKLWHTLAKDPQRLFQIHSPFEDGLRGSEGVVASLRRLI